MTNSLSGLSSQEAQERLLLEGPNEVVASDLASRLEEFKKILLDPMGLMLLGLASLYALMGSQRDALILALAYIPVTAVDVLLDLRAHKALKALRSTLNPTTKVIRDGKVKEIPTRDLVRGDTIVFEEGQSLPADGKVVEAEALSIDESALTGESIPVTKESGEAIFGGTVVLQGRGLGIIELTGKKTRFGQIASLMEETESEGSPLQKKVHGVVKRVLLVALSLAAFLFVIELFRDRGLIPSLIIALTFGMSAVPEEFPLVFTLYLSLGAWRLSRHGVLVKSLPSVEALGSVDVICTDKTGTLTEGNFQFIQFETLRSLPLDRLWQVTLMACEERPIDSMEKALFEKGASFLRFLEGWKLEWDYPFEVHGKHMSHVWKKGEAQYVIAMKGAIEGVLEHCQMSDSEKEKLHPLVEQLASKGKRLLGLACREGICSGNRLEDERDLTFLGILVFDDPIRPSARLAVESCQKSGIELKMLTGDHPITAHAVADEIGLVHSHDFLFTGTELLKLTKEERWKAYQQGAVFSRVLPEQKYEMVKALKEIGKVVAMTGDGINDAPALKLSDIGISMGANATDVARQAAQLVLLKNDFRGLVEAVFEGRKIFENLKRSFSYLIAFHLPIVFLAFFPPLLGWGDLLLPVHIVLLEMIVHPVSAFAFENLPASYQVKENRLLPKKRLLESLLSGVLLSVGSLWLFSKGMSEEGLQSGRSLALAAVLFGITFFIFVESWPARTQRLVWMGLVLVSLTLGLSLIAPLGKSFYVVPLSWGSLGLSLLIGMAASVPSFVLRVASPPGFEPGFSP